MLFEKDLKMLPRKLFYLFLLFSIFLMTIPACSVSSQDEIHLMPLERMPAEVQSAPVTVQEAYQFASANPDIMKNIPCYCGCGNIGHTSNYDCYVSGVDGQGNITFDNHALGCSICVDITQDAMRMLLEGKSPQEARVYMDATYAKYGPSNIP
jgi:Protein of unknown function with PCYCGC motif